MSRHSFMSSTVIITERIPKFKVYSGKKKYAFSFVWNYTGMYIYLFP